MAEQNETFLRVLCALLHGVNISYKPKSLKIRHLQSTDYKAINNIYKGVIKEYLKELKGARRHREFEELRKETNHDLEFGEIEFYERTKCSFIAIMKGQAVGFVLAQPINWMNTKKKQIWLEYIAVIRDFRMRGVGLALLSAVKNYAEEKQIDGIFSTLNVDNERSKKLHLKAGFEVKDWRVAFYPKSN